MILVTGGAGFIGSHLVEALLHQGRKVRILDNLSTGKIENLEEATGSRVAHLEGQTKGSRRVALGDRGEFLWGDISDAEACRKACQGVSYVFHLAALGSVQRSVEDPLSTHQANATGTLNMLQAAKEQGVKRFIYASSSSVYGNVSSDPEEVRAKEESLPPHPESPYAATKLMGEFYCRIFFSSFWTGDGFAPLLQRFWPPAGPQIHLFRGHRPLHACPFAWKSSGDLWRRKPKPRLHLCGKCGSGQSSGHGGSGDLRPGFQHRLRPEDFGERPAFPPAGDFRDKNSRPV